MSLNLTRWSFKYCVHPGVSLNDHTVHVSPLSVKATWKPRQIKLLKAFRLRIHDKKLLHHSEERRTRLCLSCLFLFLFPSSETACDASFIKANLPPQREMHAHRKHHAGSVIKAVGQGIIMGGGGAVTNAEMILILLMRLTSTVCAKFCDHPSRWNEMCWVRSKREEASFPPAPSPSSSASFSALPPWPCEVEVRTVHVLPWSHVKSWGTSPPRFFF